MFATAVLAADYAATLDLSDRTEVRARSTQQLNAPNQSAASTILGADLYTLPMARLLVRDPTLDFTATYAPSFILPDIELGLSPLLLQTGGLSAAWHDRSVRLTVGEDASYGLENSAYLPQAQVVPGQPPTPQPLAQPTTIFFGSSRTYANAAVVLGRETSLTVGAEYLWRGGTDDASREVIPDQAGPLGTIALIYRISRTDQLTTAVWAQRADFSTFTEQQCATVVGHTPPPGVICAPQNVMSVAEETLMHQVSRTVGVTLGAGVAVVTDRSIVDDPYQTTEYPVADASLHVQLGREERSAFTLLARLAPYVNTLEGIVTNNVLGEASMLDVLTERVSLRLAAGAAQTLPTAAPGAMGIAHGDVEFDYRASRSVDLAIGERAVWQQLSGTGAFVSTFGFVGVTVHPPTLHF